MNALRSFPSALSSGSHRGRVRSHLLACGAWFALFTSSVVAADTKAPETPAKAAPAVEKSAPAPRTSAPAPTNAITVDSFRIIGDRNIFNANRSGRRDRSGEEQPARVDMLSFVGTIQYAKGFFALFDGSQPGFRKGFRVGESVGEFKIAKVSADRVELERDGKTITLAVSQQLRRAEGGDWTLIGADIARAEAQAAAARQQAAATPTIPADASDTVRRMMERRMKESKQ